MPYQMSGFGQHGIVLICKRPILGKLYFIFSHFLVAPTTYRCFKQSDESVLFNYLQNGLTSFTANSSNVDDIKHFQS